MAEIQITTSQNVILNFKAAEAGERIGAYFIDLLIKYSYFFTIGYLIVKLIESSGSSLDRMFMEDQWGLMAIYIIILSPTIIYTLALETYLSGQTIGKKLMKIQVVKIDGYQAGFLDFFIRWAMRLFDINLFSGIIALISIGNSKKHQRLGGISSGTAVISFKKQTNISHTILTELNEDYVPTYQSVIKLSDNDVRIIKENLIRAKKNHDRKTILILKQKILNVTGIEPEENITAEKFINTVIEDYNYLTQNM